ncbi:protein kinase domain-containing protein [Legionella sp. CNM-1927-20]|uniref:protein kinase domain-containing protein n=1 Tax=Legionella sp. CNM-1927-20 TaxID=3422221 RepID=UPI00403AE21B
MHSIFSEPNIPVLIEEKLRDEPNGLHVLSSLKGISIFKYKGVLYEVVKNLNSGSFGRVDLLIDIMDKDKKKYVLKTMKVAAPSPSYKNLLKTASESDLLKKEEEEIKSPQSEPMPRKVNQFNFTPEEIERKAHCELKVLQHLERTSMQEVVQMEKIENDHREYIHFYILMDYCGTPLSDIIQDKESRKKYSLSEVDYLDIAITLCEDLQKLHQPEKNYPGNFHGDLKPSNILVLKQPNGQFRAYLVDFGNTSKIEQREVVTSSETVWKVKGTDTIINDENMAQYLNGEFELIEETSQICEVRLQAEFPRAGTKGYAEAKYASRSTQASEIYELGVTLAELFAFGKVEIDDYYNQPKFVFYKQSPAPEEKAIYDLVEEMVSDETKRPSLTKVIATLRQQKAELLALSVSNQTSKLDL